MLALALVASATLIAASVSPPRTLDAAGSLGGVEGFQVDVRGESLGDDEGATSSVDIRTEVEAALQSRGVRLYKQGTPIAPMSKPGVLGFLRVDVFSVNRGKSSAVRFEFSVRQQVLFASDVETTGFATTWRNGRILAWGPSTLFRSMLSAAVEDFCAEYLAARSEWLQAHAAK